MKTNHKILYLYKDILFSEKNFRIKIYKMKIKKYSIIFFLLLAVFCNITAQNKQAHLTRFLDTPAFKHASVSVCVKDFTGKEILSFNAGKSLTPASVLKVVTTASAVELLGADFKYETILSKNNEMLYIRGSGDPTLGTKRMDNDPEVFLAIWSDKVKSAFPNVKGITVVDNYFGYDGVAPRWTRQDMGNYYAAAAYGISVFDNTYQLFFNTLRSDTCPVIIKTEPDVLNRRFNTITFTNNMKLNTSGSDNGYIMGEPFSSHRLLTGNIPAGRTSFSIKGDIPDPGLYLAEVLSQNLAEKGIAVNSIKTSREYYFEDMYKKNKRTFDGQLIHTHYSPSLKDIIKEVNFRSNNHYSEHLIRTIGRRKNSNIYSSALDEGVDKVKEYWKLKGLDTDALFMYDGCGLAPANAVSAEFICDLLVYMQTKSNNAGVYLESFPQAGKEGTVRNFMKGTGLSGKVYAKSGSIANVRCYAGYYISGNKKYVFTVMVNKYNGPHNQVVKAIEKLLAGVFI